MPASRFNISPRQAVLLSLRIIWVVVILYYELGTFRYSLDQCKWPSLLATHSNPAADIDAGGTHMIVVADPEILDKRSYPGHLRLVTLFSRYLSDLNMRKSWRAAQRLNPHAAVFLGDMMHNGRADMPLREYNNYFARFKSIFHSSEPKFFVPGNRDIGLNQSLSRSQYARERYISSFGEFNRVLSVANHSIVFMDAPGLVEEDNARVANHSQISTWKDRAGGAFDFIRHFQHNMSQSDDTVILFSHIPMHRADDSTCTSAKRHGDAKGDPGFQSTLGEETTAFVLNHIQPSLIVSADEHTWCDFTLFNFAGRDTTYRTIRELTVKSFNMMNIKRPALHLLTIIPPQARPTGTEMATHADAVCLLPDQLRIYICIYLPLSILTLLVLLLVNYHRIRTSTRYRRTCARPESSGAKAPPPRSDMSRSSGRRLSVSSVQCRSAPASSTPSELESLRSPSEHKPPNDFTSPPKWLQSYLHAAQADFGEQSSDDEHIGKHKAAKKEKKQFSCPRRRAVSRRRSTRKRTEERNVMEGLCHDLSTVVLFPVVLFAAMSWWMFHV